MLRERYFHVVPDDVLSQLIEVKGRSLWEFTRNVKWFFTKNLKMLGLQQNSQIRRSNIITPPEQTLLSESPPRDTATAADGTHPTGMHSCFCKLLLTADKISFADT